jgi:hypothetical protein
LVAVTPEPVTDDRQGLTTILEQVWPSGDGVTRRSTGQAGADERTVESYRIIPSFSRARFILPVSSRRVSVRALVGYNRMRPPRVRTVRGLTAAAVATTGGRGLGEPLHIALDRRISPAEAAEHLLTSHLVTTLDTGPLRFAAGVRPLTPNRKPTVQAFAIDGTPVGYCKVGWNPTTRRQVAVEASALDHVGVRLTHTRSPRLMHSGEWHGRVIAVAAPLPLDAVSWPDDDEPPALEHLEDVAATGPTSRESLSSSSSLQRLRHAADQTSWAPDLREQFIECAAKLAASATDLSLRFGSWHGDWVPWNVARSGSRLWVWDWEHYADNTAIGLDLIHWHVQVGLQLRRLSLVAALDRAAQHCAGSLTALHGDARAADACLALYVLETVVRHERMREGGGGESPTVAPGLVAALTAMTGRIR